MIELGYAFGADMFAADGKIDPDELYVSAALARDLFPDFDADLLEQRRRQSAQLAMLRDTAHELCLPFVG